MIGSIAAVLFAAAITPGPNNLVVMSAAARGGLRGAGAPIAGIVAGTLVLVLAVQLGLNAVLAQWPAAVHVFRILAAGLLFYIGVRIVLSGWADKRASLQGDGRGLPLESMKLLVAMLALQIVNPKTWVDHLARCFLQRGGTVERAQAFAIESQADGGAVLTDGAVFKAQQVVVATGAHSKILAHSLGDEIPLETERGYNTTLPSGAVDLRTQLTFADHGFVVSKLDEGVRVGGSVELVGLKAPANF